jgi:hypothetical protein
MRKLLDWIADKLGYERKLEITAWPLKLTTPGFMTRFPLTETQSSEDWPPTYLSIDPKDEPEIPPPLMMELYEDDHGSPGKPIKD